MTCPVPIIHSPSPAGTPITLYLVLPVRFRIPVPSRSFIKQNSRIETRKREAKLDRLDSLRGPSLAIESASNETFGPLSNVTLKSRAIELQI